MSNVLVVQRTRLNGILQSDVDGVHYVAPSALGRILAGAEFQPRDDMEEDQNYKQIIPYIVLMCGMTYFTYWRTREAGEHRLHGQRSLGIGGHIEQSDSDDPQDCKAAYKEGLYRELYEEVDIQSPHTLHFLGIINSDITEVERVHVGVLVAAHLSRPVVAPRDQEIGYPAWLDQRDLKNNVDDFEGWSAAFISGLKC